MAERATLPGDIACALSARAARAATLAQKDRTIDRAEIIEPSPFALSWSAICALIKSSAAKIFRSRNKPE